MLSALTTRLEDLCNRVDAGQEREHELQGQLHATEAEYAAMDAYVEEVQRQARGLRVANEYNDVREAAMEALIASVRAAEMSRETLHARLERLANDVGHHKSVNRALAEAKALTERALALTKVRGGVQASYPHDGQECSPWYVSIRPLARRRLDAVQVAPRISCRRVGTLDCGKSCWCYATT